MDDRESRAVGLLARQRVVIIGGLAAVVAVSWAYLLWMAHDMTTWSAPGGAMPAPGVGWTLVMWIVMMAAMMLPTAAPMIVMHARFQRGRDSRRSPAQLTGLFALGYGLAWTGYALLATAAQVGLQRSAALHPMTMALTGRTGQAAVLVGAGLFQLSPLKNACLRQCRSPIGFFMTAWREGRSGALAMGVHHGSVCVGCCWALMALLFVVGTMNMLWVAGLTLFVLLEKIGPWQKLVTWATGLSLLGAGVWMLAA